MLWAESCKRCFLQSFLAGKDKNLKFVEQIGGVDISDKSGGCTYGFDNENQLELWYLTGEKKRELDTIKEGKDYTFVTEQFVDGKKDNHYERKIEILGKYAKLMTCNPERWSFAFWYRIKDLEITGL